MRANNNPRIATHSKYPILLPLEEAKNIVMYVTSGTVLQNLSDFMHDAWVIQGYAQGQILGNPDLKSYSAEDTSTDGGLAELQKVIASADGVASQGVINWLLILRWVVELIVSYYLSRKG